MRVTTLGAALSLTALLATGTLGFATSASADELPPEDVAAVAAIEHIAPDVTPLAVTDGTFTVYGSEWMQIFDEGLVLLVGTGQVTGDEIDITEAWSGWSLGKAVVDQNGRWILEASWLSPGMHRLIAMDPTGTKIEFDILIKASVKLEITSPTGGDTFETSSPIVVTGRATPGAWVNLTDRYGTVIGQTLADAEGNWEIHLVTPSEGGIFEMYAESDRQVFGVSVLVVASEAGLIEVTPIAPTLGKNGPELEEVEGLQYTVTQVSDTSWYVTAYPLDGYVLAPGAEYEWLLEASTTEPETVEPEGVLPEVVDPDITEPEAIVPEEAPLTESGEVRFASELATTGGAPATWPLGLGAIALGLGGVALTRRRPKTVLR
ncbi:MAG: Ig-like domain-containing protein [Microbacterium sp.]